MQHSEPRYTKDLDVWIATDKDNAAAIFAALREFGAPLANLTEKDFAEEGYFYQFEGQLHLKGRSYRCKACCG
jgi:hypothetical protein